MTFESTSDGLSRDGGNDSDSDSGSGFDFDSDSLDRLFDALSDPHRRYAIDYLHDQSQPVSLERLAAAVAAREAGRAIEGGFERRIALKLHHVHVPKLEEAGLVERSAAGIELTEAAPSAKRVSEEAVRAAQSND